MTPLPVLWLYGPAGVGKTTVAWELYTALAREGTPTGFVDIDQLGMCYAAPTRDDWAPEPASDPGRHRMKARNLDAVAANLHHAGARCVVVPGVVDPVRGIDADLLPRAALTRCRLRAVPGELRARIARRGGLTDPIDDVLREAAALDRNHTTDACIDTTGRTVADIVALVRERTGWPAGPAGGPGEPAPPYHGTGQILVLSGPTAVGKSTVGWQVYQQVRRAGVNAAFADLDQLGFHRPGPAGDPGSHRLKAANLAAVWQTFRASDAQCLIAVGPVDPVAHVRPYTAALPAATITLCLLRAGRDQLTGRVMARGRGITPAPGLAGDELKGQPPAVLHGVADRAAAVAEALDRSGAGDLRVDTDGRPPEDIAEQILARTGWPGPGRG